MGILDSIVEWIATQVMNLLDMITGSVLGALGCDMTIFLRYFPAAATMYEIFVAISIGFILLNLVWQLFRNFGAGIGLSAEDPVKLVIRSIVDPPHMAQWAYENGYWCSKSGSYHSLIPGVAEAWGLSCEGCTAAEPQRIVDALAEGKLVVALMSKGHFTSGGHFIVLRGVTSAGNVLVADPASYNRSEKEWDMSIILNEASRRASAGGPFWIIGNE